MRKLYYLKTIFFTALLGAFVSCGSSDDGSEYVELSPVSMDLTQVPYPKLSDYKFFEGTLSDLQPALRVLPYDLNSELFTDYAEKKRFVWMPGNVKATYDGDGKILNFPTGSALIKNFYYENIIPDLNTRIIETRVMIKKSEGWIFATYVWNTEQTEAYLETLGGHLQIEWMQGEEILSANYRIPSQSECGTCHSNNDIPIPIGPKPQNLNKLYNYTDGVQNQLSRWIQEGYLDSKPETILTSVNWQDESLPLELRARAYLDINCAYCHSPGGNCDYTPMNLAFAETTNPLNLGICIEPVDFVTGNQEHIIEKQDPRMSLLYFRMQTVIPIEMMPPTGRSIAHTEGLQLLEDWINSLEGECP